MVLAGREPPAAAWRSEAAWRELLRVVALRNLGPEESRAYLGAAGVPKALHEPVLAFTHGHPLALSLVVDVLAQEQRQGLAGFTPSMPPTSSASCCRASLPTFPAICTGARWRCAHARLTTESLLRAALDAGDVHDIFEWLRSLSFIEQAVRLALHDLARDLLDADLRWRDREQYGVQHDRVRSHVLDRIRRSTGQEQQRALLDLMFLHRSNSVHPAVLGVGELRPTYADASPRKTTRRSWP